MKQATSKIKEVVKTKDFTNSFGNTIYHDLLMENGDKIQIGKKAPQKVGWELSYEIEAGGAGEQGEFKKAKSIKIDQVQGSPNVNFTNEGSKGVNVQNLIVAQSSVASACQYLQNKESDKEHILEVAEMIYTFVISKG